MRLDESIPGGVHDYCAPELTAAPTRLPRILHEILEFKPDVLCLQARSRSPGNLDGISARSRRYLGDISARRRSTSRGMRSTGNRRSRRLATCHLWRRSAACRPPKASLLPRGPAEIICRDLFAEMRSRDCRAVTSRLPARAHAVAPSHPSQHAHPNALLLLL